MRRSPIDTDSNGYQVTSDGVTVWVNGPDGCSTGRFGLQGIDIHRPFEEQQTKGACLFCTHGLTTVEDWFLFVEKMKELYDVDVDFRHTPMRFHAIYVPAREFHA